ncbi:MAG: alpha/beta hydrolase [Deltaproteobacteria bacterium]|nr:alpha/beta hydrolase [Deltaproteobacteria bacterium]
MTSGWGERIRRRAGSVVMDGFYGGLARLFQHHPLAKPGLYNVEVLRDIPYTTSGRREHLLDVYRPTDREGPRPVVLYVHGGGFRILSKDTHWVMGLAFARRGFVVFNISYRLAPAHRYPAALEDAAAAYVWLARSASAYGGDLGTLVLAGESAGANLVTALTVAACYRRDEPLARAVWDTGVVPRGLWPACGLLQATDSARFARRRHLPSFVADRLVEVESAYLGEDARPGDPRYDLADPLCVLERGVAPERPLPACFTSVGTKDPILDDTRRLRAAYDRLGVPCEDRYYEGEMHAFQALAFRPNARACWRDTFAFFEQHLGMDLCATTHLPLEGPSSILTALWRTRSPT